MSQNEWIPHSLTHYHKSLWRTARVVLVLSIDPNLLVAAAALGPNQVIWSEWTQYLLGAKPVFGGPTGVCVGKKFPG